MEKYQSCGNCNRGEIFDLDAFLEQKSNQWMSVDADTLLKVIRQLPGNYHQLITESLEAYKQGHVPVSIEMHVPNDRSIFLFFMEEL